jgi:hypothetical protein
MPSKRASKRSESAHAGAGRIDINGHASREPGADSSGGSSFETDSTAGPRTGSSSNVSGDVSAADVSNGNASARASGRRGSAKKYRTPKSRRKDVVRDLSHAFDADKLLDESGDNGAGVGESQEEEEVPPPAEDQSLPQFFDADGQPVDLSQLKLGEEATRAAVLGYLTSDRVVQWMAAHDSSASLQVMINDIMGGESAPTPRPKKTKSAKPSDHADTKNSRKRVSPSPGSYADLGSHYRLGGGLSGVGATGVVGQLAAQQKRQRSQVTRGLAGLTAGVVPETPIGCSTAAEAEADELLSTVQRVLKRRGDLMSLPRQERLRKATSMALREIHKTELEKIRKVDADDDPSSSGSSSDSSSSGGSSGMGSESVGDTCKSSRSGSVGSYDRRDHFVDDSDRGSETDSDAEGKKQCKKRVQARSGAMNGLGTPSKSKAASSKTSMPDTDAAASSGPDVLMFGDDDLKQWQLGTARYKQGANWESYLHHKQAYDSYMQHKGKYSKRTFKSIIHANLVPAICSVCGFLRSKWASVEDERLILKLEKALAPARSTDFAVDLRALRLYKQKPGGEPLMARYAAYAEKFIYKCSEAEDAGKRIKPNVIRAAFKSEVEKEEALKHWLQEVRWTGVESAHRRLLRKLNGTRSIQQLFNSNKPKHTRDDDRDDGSGGSDQEGREHAPRRRVVHKRRAGKNNAGKKLKKRGAANYGEGREQSKRTSKGDKGPKIRSWSYDKRGPSWHTDTELYDCFDKPCRREFCQRCRCHGHTAEFCRKADDTPGLTREGYAQENAKGKAALQAPPPARPAKSNKARAQDRRSHSDDDAHSDGGSDRVRSSGRESQSGRQSRGSQCSSDEEEGRSEGKGRGNAARGWRRSCL